MISETTLKRLIWAALDNDNANNFVDIKELKAETLKDSDDSFDGTAKLVELDNEFFIVVDSVSGDDTCEKFENEDAAIEAFDKMIADMQYFNAHGEL